MEQKALRISALVLAVALGLRLLSAAAPAFTLTPQVTAWMLFFQTGRLVRPANITFSASPESEQPTISVPQIITPDPEPTVVTFSPEDVSLLSVNCSFDYSADLSALLTQPLNWDLTGTDPTVLILHSHATESFTPTGDYTETTAYHTADTSHNMISVGAYLAQFLEEGGIQVIHDTTPHDSPSYNEAYTNSRKSVQTYLDTYPSIQLVLDLHRDSIEDTQGNQVVRSVFSQGTTLANLMFVVGTDYGGWEHPQWQENLSVALKLQTQLERLCPGICRSINLRSQRFNQDLSAGALLIEVGSCGNTHAEALRSARLLGEAILSLAHGSI